MLGRVWRFLVALAGGLITLPLALITAVLLIVLLGLVGIFALFLLLFIGGIVVVGLLLFCGFLAIALPVYVFLLIWKEPNVPVIRIGRFHFPP